MNAPKVWDGRSSSLENEQALGVTEYAKRSASRNFHRVHFVMILSGADAPTPAPCVPAVDTQSGVGLYCEQSERFLKPCPVAIRAALPARLRKAFDRGAGNCWFDKASRIDSTGKLCGPAPYLPLSDAKGNRVETAYFQLCSEEAKQ
jgi:hypothetical protein